MEQERNQAELENAFLRSQINPHLLFNSLQFIQHHVDIGSPKALQAVQLLGEIMHYSLRTGEHNTVPLEDELEYIRQYAELAQLRSDHRHHFELQVNTNTSAPNLELPPGILGNFIENVFKHGDLSEKEDPAVGQINVTDRRLTVLIRNLKRPETIYRKTGIGMKNIRKRLELLYPGRYSLSTTEENNHFNLSFEIEL